MWYYREVRCITLLLAAAVTAQDPFLLLREARGGAAVKSFRSALKRQPGDALLQAGLARALLTQDKTDEALRIAQAAALGAPRNATVHSALGDVLYRRSEFEPAMREYLEASRLDRQCARAWRGQARVLETDCREDEAGELLDRAHRLHVNDPEILRDWAEWDESRLGGLEKYLTLVPGLPKEERISIRSHLELHRALAGKRIFVPDEPAPQRAVPLRSTDGSLEIEVTLNRGKPLRMKFDTGASHILITRRAAERNGVRRLTGSIARGVGDMGGQQGYFGLAERMQIGEFVFRNCVVQVIGDAAGGRDGIFGVAPLTPYLVTLDYGVPELRLEEWHATPEFTKVRRVEHMMLVDTAVNDTLRGYFLIDSGANFNVISSVLAAKGLPIHPETNLQVRGVSGMVNRRFSTSSVELHFGAAEFHDDRALIFDLTSQSHAMGVEISGLLGDAALRKFAVTLNYRDGRMRFSPTAEAH